MTNDEVVQAVQIAFPQIYLACHTRHQRKKTTPHRLSQRDAAILAHLDPSIGTTPARLAKHLGIARSTLSEALKRLIASGFVRRESGRTTVVLSDVGMRAIQDTSVLETDRLSAAIETLSRQNRTIVARGLRLLADACRQLSQSE